MHRGKGMKFVGDSRVPANGRMPNVPKDYSEYPGKTEAFWPNFLLKEWLVGAVFLVGFLILTVSHEPPLEKIADPSDTAYIPMPDWYFLFLYQLLKYTYASNQYIIFGTLIIPGLAFGALLLAPFLDRGPERRPSKRPLATGFMLLALASITYLTWEAYVNHDWAAAKEQGKIPETAIDRESEGYQIVEANGCISCHGGELEGNGPNPPLVGTGLTSEEIAEIAKNGKGDMPAGMFTGSEEELEKMTEFLANLKKE